MDPFWIITTKKGATDCLLTPPQTRKQLNQLALGFLFLPLRPGNHQLLLRLPRPDLDFLFPRWFAVSFALLLLLLFLSVSLFRVLFVPPQSLIFIIFLFVWRFLHSGGPGYLPPPPP